MSELKWTFEVCQKLASKYKTRKDFRMAATNCYNKCVLMKWTDLVCSHMTDSRKKTAWTLEKCLALAKNYEYLSDFSRDYPHCYLVCKKNKWVKKISRHMSAPKIDLDEIRVVQPKVETYLTNLGLKFEKEVNISKRSRVDFVVTNRFGFKYLLEVKSDKKRHSSRSLKSQLDKYRLDGQLRYGVRYEDTVLVSENGRYGVPINDLKEILSR